MKEFINRILVNPLKGNMGRNEYPFMPDSVSLQPSVSNTSGGCLYTYSQDYIIDTPDKDVLNEFKVTRSCSITLYDSEGELYNFGSISYPAKVTIIPSLQKSTLKIEYSAPYSV